MSRPRPAPAGRYVLPQAATLVDQEGDHDADLDVTTEKPPNYLSWVAETCARHLGHRVLEDRGSDEALRASFGDRLVAITGGSSGIGYAIAQRLTGLGARIVLIADEPNKLDGAA